MTYSWKTELRFWLITFVVFFAAIYVLRGILLPFVAGMAIAYLLDPVCDWLEHHGLSRTLATSLLTVAFLLLIVGGFLLLAPLVVGQVAGLIAQVPDLFKLLTEQIEQLFATVQSRVDDSMRTQIQAVSAGFADKLVGWLTALLGGLASRGAAFANLLSLLVITPVVTFYLLRDWDRIVETIDSWLPKHLAETIRQQMGNVDEMLAGFVRGQSSVCLILGVFYAIGLTAAGLNFGLLIGMLAGILTFIPFVGSAVGLVASVGMALVQFDDWVRIVIVAAIFVVGQVLEGNLLTPKLVGERVGLHPVWVIFALLAGGYLFGFVGVLLAVPVAAVIGVLTRFMLGRYLASVFHLGDTASETPDDPAPNGPAPGPGDG